MPLTGSAPLWLAAWIFALTAAYLVCVAASCLHYRRGPEEGPVSPMTVIRPMRGAEEGVEENLRALVEADPEGVLQVLLAMESAADPAHAVAARVAAARPGREVRIVITGPAGRRMGKIHNMIEALKEARHPLVVFSDADVRPGRELLAETSRAFAEGAGAVWAVPYASGQTALSEVLLGFCFNHFYVVPIALLHRLGAFHAFAGGWMAYRKETLERLGGLAPFERHIADDHALGQAAARSGARVRLLRQVAPIYERASGLADAFGHFMKWIRVIRFCAPWAYPFMVALNPVFLSLALCAADLSRPEPAGWPAALLAAVAALRAAGAWLQDRAVAGGAFPAWAYPLVPLSDAVLVGLGVRGLFGDTVVWRGKRYRLRYGGQVEALS